MRRSGVNPYWLEDEDVPRASPRHEGTVDVAIVGAGVTGCAAALRLAEAGLRVRVHDERAVAEGASGRNGGFALRGGASRYDVARETYGVEQARGMWNWTERALDRIGELAGDALRRPGSFRLAADEEEREQIHAEYEAFRADGIEAEWFDDLPGVLAGRFEGGILHAGDGALQPARWVRRLAALAADAGAEIREHDRVDDVAALDAEQVIAIVLEQLPPVDLRLFPPRPRRFRIAHLGRVEGFNGPRWDEIVFRDHGRAFYIFVGVGSRAGSQVPALLDALDSLRVR